VKGVPTNEGEEEEHSPFKKMLFTAISLSSMKMVADRRRHAAYHNKHWQHASRNVNIDHLE